jgi:hypothetical protein
VGSFISSWLEGAVDVLVVAALPENAVETGALPVYVLAADMFPVYAPAAVMFPL